MITFELDTSDSRSDSCEHFRPACCGRFQAQGAENLQMRVQDLKVTKTGDTKFRGPCLAQLRVNFWVPFLGPPVSKTRCLGVGRTRLGDSGFQGKQAGGIRVVSHGNHNLMRLGMFHPESPT